MDAKTYLNQIIKLDNSIYMCNEQLIVLEQKMIYSSPAGNDSIGSGASVQYVQDKLPMQIAQKEILEQKIMDMEKDLIIKKAQIMKSIDKLDDEFMSEILFMRYLRKMPINKIADRLDKPIKWVYQKHTDGINAIQIQLFSKNRLVLKKYKVYNVDQEAVIFTGTFSEIANHFNKDVSFIVNTHYQYLTILGSYILEDDDVEKQLVKIGRVKKKI